MMTTQEERDPRLRELFAQSRQDLAADDFTDAVIASSRRLKHRLIGGLAVMALAIGGLLSLLSLPLLDFAYLVSRFLTQSLVDLGGGWLALIAAPLNNVGSLLLLLARLARTAWKKLACSD